MGRLLLLMSSHRPQQGPMLMMCENVGGLLHRSDEIHTLIGPLIPHLRYFGLHLSRIRPINPRQLSSISQTR